MNSELERIVVLLAGYNPQPNFITRTINSAKMKIFYNEELIDTTDKANTILDFEHRKRSITYPLEALADLGYAKAIIIGNEANIHSTLEDSKKAKSVVEAIIPMGNSFLINVNKGRTVWDETYLKFSEQLQISPHKFFLFGDTFTANPIALDSAFRAMEERDADLSFGYVTKKEDDIDKRWLFSYRPWGEFTLNGEPILFRNANIGAERATTYADKFPRGVPESGAELIQTAYNVRKAWNPLNWIKAAQAVGSDGFKLLYQKLTGTIDLLDIEHLMTNKLKCDVGLVEVDASLEPDVDSEGDVYRARKMVYLEQNPLATIDEITTEFTHKQNSVLEHKSSDKIVLVNDKIHKEKLKYVQSLISEFKSGDFSHSPYTIRSFDSLDIHLAHLKYDLDNSN
ncbi:hypothetical protein JXM83_04420 [Candidatus Woesearchaeota archaeon]|nr:hypothetical protein [Candidatus Woesearchaeota archaeon]